jgi:branched-chain amino acid transport system substrate-binding protein
MFTKCVSRRLIRNKERKMGVSKRAVTAGLSIVVATALAACGSSDSGSGSEGGGPLSGEVVIVTVPDLTGDVAPYGKAQQAGHDFAVKEINASGMLGDATLKLDVIDAASEVQPAVDATTKAVQSDAVAVVSPVFSTQVLSMAPIAQRSKLPFVAVQAGVPGIVENGDYVFRITTPQDQLVGATEDCLATKGITSVAMIYQDFNATLKDLVEKAFPPLFDDDGIDVLASEGYPSGTTDFSSIVTEALSGSPDAVGVIASGSDVSSIITQLDRQGYDGQLFGQAGMGAALLEPVSKEAEGTIWSATFAPELADSPDAPSSTKDFVANWTKEFGTPPDNFNAEGYDAIYLIAQALAEADSTDREKVRDAMQKITEEGFDGAQGSLKFDERDARVSPVTLEWTGGGQKVAQGC